MSVLLASLDPDFVTSERVEILKRYAGGRRLVLTQSRREMEAVIEEVEISIGKVSPDLLALAPRLKWHQHLGTGTEWLWTSPEAMERPFILTNCSDDYGVVLAEHVMALLLAFARQLPENFESQQRSAWERPVFNDPSRFEVCGKTLLLIGTGSIGKAIARMAQGFSMTVHGLRSDPSKVVPGIDRMHGADDLHVALGEADLVVNSLPLTPRTRGFIDERAFQVMKPSAYFINIGRGATVDEQALVRALECSEIAGAGLDVFETQPLPETSPLWSLPNVIITPHCGGNHRNRYSSWLDTALDNLRRYSENASLRNVVDKKAGY